MSLDKQTKKDKLSSPKALRSLRSSGRSKGESAQENRTYVERLVKRIVEHVSYREAVRCEPKIIECLELYQQDMWECEHNKRELAALEKKKGSEKARPSRNGNSKKKRSGQNQLSGSASAGSTTASAPSSSRPSLKERRASLRERRRAGEDTTGTARGDGHGAGPADTKQHSGVYNFGALMKQAKTLQEFETTGKKPKKTKKERKRPDTVDNSVGFRERSQSVSHSSDGNLGKKGWGKARRLSLPTAGSRTDYRAARYNSSNYDSNGNPLQQAYPFPNPNIFSLAGCSSNQLLQRVLYLACQQNETIKFEKKVRKERERTSQMPVLASSVNIQLLCAKGAAHDTSTSEKSWNSYF